MINYQNLLDANDIVCTAESKQSQVINENNLRSALGVQFWYENKQERACALFRSLIIGHGFQDGNKRTATIILLASGGQPKVSKSEIANVAIKVAMGSLREVADIKKSLYG